MSNTHHEQRNTSSATPAENTPIPPSIADPMCPAASLLPLGDHSGVPVRGDSPGRVRPLSAALSVPAPLVGKKHDTTASRITRTVPTQYVSDGKRHTDTEQKVSTDT